MLAPEPNPRPFSVELLPVSNGVAVVAVEGELDVAATKPFREAVEAGLGAGASALVLDLAGAGFMDSSMLRELLWTRGAAEERGATIVLAGLQPPVQRLLDLTRTMELFPVEPTREAAVARARS